MVDLLVQTAARCLSAYHYRSIGSCERYIDVVFRTTTHHSCPHTRTVFVVLDDECVLRCLPSWALLPTILTMVVDLTIEATARITACQHRTIDPRSRIIDLVPLISAYHSCPKTITTCIVFADESIGLAMGVLTVHIAAVSLPTYQYRTISACHRGINLIRLGSSHQTRPQALAACIVFTDKSIATTVAVLTVHACAARLPAYQHRSIGSYHRRANLLRPRINTDHARPHPSTACIVFANKPGATLVSLTIKVATAGETANNYRAVRAYLFSI